MSTFYKVIKFNFNNPVYCADGVLVNMPREISAIKITQEILQASNDNELRESVINGTLSVSDCQPFYKNELMLLKPLIGVKNIDPKDTVVRKKIKILDFIPLREIDSYCNGSLDWDYSRAICDHIGVLDIVKDKSNYTFNKDAGLYILIQFNSFENYKRFYQYLNRCIYNIFGTTNVCLFEEEFHEAKEIMFSHGTKYILLNSVIPNMNTLKKINVNDAYEIIDVKLKTINRFAFASGSCFSETFKSDNSIVGSNPIFLPIK